MPDAVWLSPVGGGRGIRPEQMDDIWAFLAME